MADIAMPFDIEYGVPTIETNADTILLQRVQHALRTSVGEIEHRPYFGSWLHRLVVLRRFDERVRVLARSEIIRVLSRYVPELRLSGMSVKRFKAGVYIFSLVLSRNDSLPDINMDVRIGVK